MPSDALGVWNLSVVLKVLVREAPLALLAPLGFVVVLVVLEALEAWASRQVESDLTWFRLKVVETSCCSTVK